MFDRHEHWKALLHVQLAKHCSSVLKPVQIRIWLLVLDDQDTNAPHSLMTNFNPEIKYDCQLYRTRD
jgi:hypothetical protein